jgi:hypothetical protein
MLEYGDVVRAENNTMSVFLDADMLAIRIYAGVGFRISDYFKPDLHISYDIMGNKFSVELGVTLYRDNAFH